MCVRKKLIANGGTCLVKKSDLIRNIKERIRTVSNKNSQPAYQPGKSIGKLCSEIFLTKY